MKPIALSARLRAVASMVTRGNRVCDVGCDHGFVSIYLIEQGVSPRALAMDVRCGPLGAAKAHIAERGLEAEIETRLSDGLHNYKIGEADTLICAGMGGRLMTRILSEDRDKTASFREMVLQPQSEVEQFRGWLEEQGYPIVEEDMIEEDGKFYPMMRVAVIGEGGESAAKRPEADDREVDELCKLLALDMPDIETLCKPNRSVTLCKLELAETLCKLNNRYGPLLLKRRDKTLAAYLKREERLYKQILTDLSSEGLSDEKRRTRYEEVSALLSECRMAMRIVGSEADGEKMMKDNEKTTKNDKKRRKDDEKTMKTGEGGFLW